MAVADASSARRLATGETMAKIRWRVTALVSTKKGIRERKITVCAKPYGVAAVKAARRKVGGRFLGLTGRMDRGGKC